MQNLCLSALSPRDLNARFRAGTCPPCLRSLEGDHDGVILTLRPVSGSRVFWRRLSPHLTAWHGKFFEITGGASARSGTGGNRVDVRGRGERRMLPFDVSLAASELDGSPCVRLDYDRPDNARPVRRMHDELREVESGVLLGAAYLRLPFKPRHVSWFSLMGPRLADR